MDNTNNNNEIKTQFDWDNINVGDYNMDNSENFFDAASNKENAKQELFLLNLSNDLTQEDLKLENKTEELEHVEEKEEKFYCKQEINEKPKLKMNWSPFPASSDAGSGSGRCCIEGLNLMPPKAYEYKDVYQMKREMALKQREEEERKARQFYSRPVPNFKAMHRRIDEMVVVHRITVPVTPETVKHAVADKERRRRREEVGQSQVDNGKLMRRPLHETKPFQLRADQRVRERREYDAQVQDNMAQKKKQQEEERRQREEEEMKELRKMTEFKARRNPFK